MAKQGLGKGLGALLDNQATVAITRPRREDGLLRVSLSKIDPNPHQPRRQFDEAGLKELAASLKSRGMIQPLLLRPAKAEGRYEIVTGERRFRAARLAGLNEVPAILRKLSDKETMAAAIVENVQREDLNAMEEAEGYRHLVSDFDLTQEEVAELVGKPRPTVANALRLLKLPEHMGEALRDGKISAGHGRAILSIGEGGKAQRLFEEILTAALSVREAEDLAATYKELRGTPKKSKVGTKRNANPEFQRLADTLIKRLGTRVTFSGSYHKGHVDLAWYSKDDLERILEYLKLNNP